MGIWLTHRSAWYTMSAAAATVLAVDESLVQLAEEDPAAAEVVKLHFFAGLTLAWQLHVRLAARPLGPALAPFREFRFGDLWVWGVVASITVWLVPALATLKLAALNLAVVLGALYLLRGAAVVVRGHARVTSRRTARRPSPRRRAARCCSR